MARKRNHDNAGFWDRPQLMNLIADLLFFAAALGLGYAATLAVARLPFFPLRAVTVADPLQAVTQTQVEYAARNAVAGNFFTVNLEAVQAAFEKLPWVRKAEVRRRWPDGLELAIEEHVAAARWKHADGTEARLVNRQGEVFAASSSADLPLFVGPEGTAPLILARYQELQPLLEPIGRQPQSLALSPREAWQMRLDDGVLLELGRDQAKSRVNDRLQRFAAAYRQAAERLKVRTDVIDLRYPNGFAMRVARAGEGKK
ncbi:MAG: cell division protein FtsQ/DivIB [Rhodocyclaceae bacterium]|nr:cell division protein FtsQ/DivIB [Rhodocyclaceae bacterium]